VQWVGETQVLSQLGTLPITFPLEAKTLEEAAKKFGAEAKKAIERTVRELQEMRRQAASSIVIPQGGLPPMPPGGVPGGGGKIQIP
jgi:PHP family Zn ribbon phosphoesterase